MGDFLVAGIRPDLAAHEPPVRESWGSSHGRSFEMQRWPVVRPAPSPLLILLPRPGGSGGRVKQVLAGGLSRPRLKKEAGKDGPPNVDDQSKPPGQLTRIGPPIRALEPSAGFALSTATGVRVLDACVAGFDSSDAPVEVLQQKVDAPASLEKQGPFTRRKTVKVPKTPYHVCLKKHQCSIRCHQMGRSIRPFVSTLSRCDCELPR